MTKKDIYMDFYEALNGNSEFYEMVMGREGSDMSERLLFLPSLSSLTPIPKEDLAIMNDTLAKAPQPKTLPQPWTVFIGKGKTSHATLDKGWDRTFCGRETQSVVEWTPPGNEPGCDTCFRVLKVMRKAAGS